MHLDHFDVLMSKIIFKNKKYYFHIFLNEKHFKKQPQLQSHSKHPLKQNKKNHK